MSFEARSSLGPFLINPFMLQNPLEKLIWIFDTFDNNLKIKYDFTKVSSENEWQCSDLLLATNFFPNCALEIFLPELSNCFWPFAAIMG